MVSNQDDGEEGLLAYQIGAAMQRYRLKDIGRLLTSIPSSLGIFLGTGRKADQLIGQGRIRRDEIIQLIALAAAEVPAQLRQVATDEGPRVWPDSPTRKAHG